MTKSRGIRGPRRAWTPAEVELLRRRYAHVRAQVLADELGRPVSQVYCMAQRLGLCKTQEFRRSADSGRTQPGQTTVGRNTQFAPGNEPWNKGRNWNPEGSRATQFKPGHRPHGWRPVGALRINSEGYLQRKTSDTGVARHDWVSVHRLVWIEVNGPVPDGHVVVFKPGRRTAVEADITPDAVELVTRAQVMERNSVHRLPPELVAICQLRAALKRQIDHRAEKEGTPS